MSKNAVHGAEDKVLAELEGLTLSAALRRSARLYARNEFLKSTEGNYLFEDFDRTVDRMSSGLLKLGVVRGDKVAVWLANSLEWITTLYACARIGAVLVPINTRYTASEAGYILKQSDARVLVMKRRIWGNDYVSMLTEIAPSLGDQAGTTLELTELPELRSLVVVDDSGLSCSISFERLITCEPSAGLAAAEAAVRPDDALLIVYTSGTTGKPKGAMHNHRVIKQATRVGLRCLVEPGSRVLGHMPLYHVAGLYMALIPAMTLGACLIIMPQWDAAKALDTMEQEKVNMFGGVPTHFVDLVSEMAKQKRALTELRAAWIGGSPVMQATFEHFMGVLGLKHLLSTYGMTENTISTTFNRLDDPIEACCENRAPILGDCEVRVVDPLTGEDRPVGEIGEVWCRGETVMMGYYKNPVATQEAIDEHGWLNTGDLGRFDAQGYLSITGRTKEMYKSGGTNVYPAEIEQHLIRHPAIEIAAVIGVPDERLGEVGYAFIQRHADAEFSAATLREHCHGALASYKIPRHCMIVDELPRTSTGKIERSALFNLAKTQLDVDPSGQSPCPDRPDNAHNPLVKQT